VKVNEMDSPAPNYRLMVCEQARSMPGKETDLPMNRPHLAV